MKTITGTEIRRANNNAQLNMLYTNEKVFVGDIYSFGKEGINIEYRKLCKGISKFDLNSFVKKYLFNKCEDFYSAMGYAYRNGQSKISAPETGRYFMCMIQFMDKNVKLLVSKMLVTCQEWFNRVFEDENVLLAKEVVAKKRGKEIYYAKKVEANRFMGMTIRERHEAEREAKAEYVYAYLKNNGYIDENNIRSMSVKEMNRALSNIEEMIPGLNMPVLSITRTDIEFVVKFYDVKGRRAGRPKKSEDNKIEVKEEEWSDAVLPSVEEPEEEVEEIVVKPSNDSYMEKKDPRLSSSVRSESSKVVTIKRRFLTDNEVQLKRKQKAENRKKWLNEMAVKHNDLWKKCLSLNVGDKKQALCEFEIWLSNINIHYLAA